MSSSSNYALSETSYFFDLLYHSLSGSSAKFLIFRDRVTSWGQTYSIYVLSQRLSLPAHQTTDRLRVILFGGSTLGYQSQLVAESFRIRSILLLTQRSPSWEIPTRWLVITAQSRLIARLNVSFVFGKSPSCWLQLWVSLTSWYVAGSWSRHQHQHQQQTSTTMIPPPPLPAIVRRTYLDA